MFSRAGFILKTRHQQNFIEFLLACLLIKQYSSVYLTTNLLQILHILKNNENPLHICKYLCTSVRLLFLNYLFTLVNFSVAVFPWEIPNLYLLNAVGSPVSHVAIHRFDRPASCLGCAVLFLHVAPPIFHLSSFWKSLFSWYFSWEFMFKM